ncbi:hypothetical protein DH2020_028011 [Rehmannia glutinosa]|uniref:Non-haem dioxygenase N-terminal domain-containing protein n=1 Tax=Rehmannia glutinosa TaxID=99300 RepID=A0ABR0VTL8_REHGL
MGHPPDSSVGSKSRTGSPGEARTCKGNGVKGLSQLNLKKTPNQFIQPPEKRLSHIHVSTQESVPIIDVSKWDDDPKVAESICEAAKKWGFFQIINHGVPLDVLENVKRAAHEFFELPVEERRKYLKENSPTQTVMLKTSFNPLAEKVLEWKDYLVHFMGQGNNEDFKLWPPVSSYLRRSSNGINVNQIDEVKEDRLMGSRCHPSLLPQMSDLILILRREGPTRYLADNRPPTRRCRWPLRTVCESIGGSM